MKEYILGTSFTPELHESAISKYIDKVTDISKMLQDMGYRGIAGFDSIIDENDQLIPAVEINARFTQVTYLLPWVKLLQDQFPYIESRYVKLFSEREHSFTEIAEKCAQVIHGEYTIYTFAKERNERGYVYKVFSMFYSNTLDQLNRMIDQFSGIAL